VFRHTIPIGKIFGIRVDLDYSWFLIAALLTWLMATAYYPAQYRTWTAGEYWLIGALTAVLLFISVLIHEFAHSLVAKSYGIDVSRITLFIFGGISQIAGEPRSAGEEFWIAIVGPITSLALGIIFWELEPLVAGSQPFLALFQYLFYINIALGIFNLIPGFPLDGGRVLRAIVWRITGKYRRATAIAATTGRFFGFLLIFAGVVQAVFGNLFNGIWIAFIGWFLESAAGSQLQMEVVKSLTSGHTVGDAMRHDIAQVPADVSVQDAVDHYVLNRGIRSFVVTSNGTPVGMATLSDVGKLPRESWPITPVSQIMRPLTQLQTVRPSADLWNAVEKMGRENSGVVGMLTREDLVHYLQFLQSRHA
jgi:Zn-dependent protease/CBS domain-containing protein